MWGGWFKSHSAGRRHQRVLLHLLLLLSVMPFLMNPIPGTENATTRYEQNVSDLLLEHGYAANIIAVQGTRGLRASQRSYTNSLWTRDLDYAISGYAYPLSDMSVFRDNITTFLTLTDAEGVVPETIYLDRGLVENRASWDSMPNLIHAVYVYVAKTGDQAFYQEHRATLERIGMWIVRLDSDGDGLPDRDIFPFGYYDSVRNSVMHTYALAKFYSAFRELAALETFVGQDGTIWQERAARLREAFHRPTTQGGYWLDDQVWPIAWRSADGQIVSILETFGVFEALRSGLIAPDDGPRYGPLVVELARLLPTLLDGPTPMKLTLGGYPPEVRREVDPPVPLWMLDASAPWIVGIAAPAYTNAGCPDAADRTMRAYTAMARATYPPVVEFAAGPDARYGAGNSADGGRAWDSAAWFMAIYGGHYGLTMTPEALLIRPRPYRALQDDGISNFTYQGTQVQLRLDMLAEEYYVQADKSARVVLYPMNSGSLLQVNNGPALPKATLTLTPDREYRIRNVTSVHSPVRFPTRFTAR
ncbi:MAG: hypothetical protein AAGF95_25530 [Chloroflexota bacterium]